MIRQILKQLQDNYNKYNRYPEYINITKKQYQRLKKELSIVENINEDIKSLYFLDFNIVEENWYGYKRINVSKA